MNKEATWLPGINNWLGSGLCGTGNGFIVVIQPKDGDSIDPNEQYFQLHTKSLLLILLQEELEADP